MITEYDADYFERGVLTGKSCYENYRWMPDETIKMAQSIIKHLRLTPDSRVLEVGCAKGFLETAFQCIGFDAIGTDVSEYAIENAHPDVRNKVILQQSYTKLPFKDNSFDVVITKDVLEHQRPEHIEELLKEILRVAPRSFHIIPIAHNKRYICSEYESDATHKLRFTATEWGATFTNSGGTIHDTLFNLKDVKERWTNRYVGGNIFVSVNRIPDINVVVVTTGDPRYADVLFRSLEENTEGSCGVTVMKQNRLVHEDVVSRFYHKWENRHPEWRFLVGNENMILGAWNLGLMAGSDSPWQLTIDDDIWLPPGWDTDMIEGAKACPDTARLFAPLLTDASGLVYRDQVAVPDGHSWFSFVDGGLLLPAQWYSSKFRSKGKPRIKKTNVIEYSCVLRKKEHLADTVWDTAFDMIRHGHRANEEMSYRFMRNKWDMYIIQSVAILHRRPGRNFSLPLYNQNISYLDAHLLNNYPEYRDMIEKFVILKDNTVTVYGGGRNDLAKINMGAGFPEHPLCVGPESWGLEEFALEMVKSKSCSECNKPGYRITEGKLKNRYYCTYCCSYYYA